MLSASSCSKTAWLILAFSVSGPALAQNTSRDVSTPQQTQGESETSPSAFPDLSIPGDATVQQLLALIERAKAIQPRSQQQYRAMQTTIRDASKLIKDRLADQSDSETYRQAELDVISSSVMLMTFFGPDAQQKTLEQVHDFLKKRKVLSFKDIQTAMMAATMLELQPNKTPAKSTYQLLDDLLADDERANMQNFRLILQANLRRLSLLGNKMEMEAESTTGDLISIEDYADRFLLVHFFAFRLTPNQECEACLTELPQLRTTYEKYQAKGLEIISVNLDADPDVFLDYLEKEPIPWPVIRDSANDPTKTLRMQFGISQLPSVFLLNKEGTVVSLAAHGAELERLMQMLFESPTVAPDPVAGGEGTGPDQE